MCLAVSAKRSPIGRTANSGHARTFKQRLRHAVQKLFLAASLSGVDSSDGAGRRTTAAPLVSLDYVGGARGGSRRRSMQGIASLLARLNRARFPLEHSDDLGVDVVVVA